MRIAPDARPDDGLFDVVIIGDFGRFEAIRHLLQLYKGTHVNLAKVRVLRARRLEVDAAEPVGIETDGEPAGSTPAVFEVVPAALDVLIW
jgi:diacylglycerol kinase family enzyme